MKEIFTKQFELNETVFATQKLPTWRSIVADEHYIPNTELQALWVENMRKALSSEFAELLEELTSADPNDQNIKVETIDILHFLVSLSQLTGVSPDDANRIYGEVYSTNGYDRSMVRVISDWVLAINDLQNAGKWKWWAKGGGFNPAAARDVVLKLWKLFWQLTQDLKLTRDDVKSIYFQKHQVNLNRQAQDYNEDTKTESDNLSIAV